jgi:ubiquinone/menaquinone biosynthesis C-methylase UbiE
VTDDQSQVRQLGWNEWLAAQEQRLGPQLARTRDALLTHAAIRTGAVVLDIGAGRGLVALAAAERVGLKGRVIACDIDAECLAALASRAREEGVAARMRVFQANATALPLAPASIDVVTARSVLEFVEDRPALASEAFRVLRPGGRISCFATVNRYVTPHHHLVDLSGLGELAESIEAFFEELYADPFEPTLTFDERDLVELLEAAGFVDVGLNFILGWQRSRLSPEEAHARLVDRGVADRPSILELLTFNFGFEAAARYASYFAQVASQTVIAERRASAFVWGRRDHGANPSL